MGIVRGLRKTSSNMECQFWRNRAPKADVFDSTALLLPMLEPRFEVMVVLLCRMVLVLLPATVLLVPDVLLLLLDMFTPLRRYITCSVVFRDLVVQI